MSASVPGSFNRSGLEHWRRNRRLSVSILEEAGRRGLKCLLLSYFRVGDNPTGTPKSWLDRGSKSHSPCSQKLEIVVTEKRTFREVRSQLPDSRFSAQMNSGKTVTKHLATREDLFARGDRAASLAASSRIPADNHRRNGHYGGGKRPTTPSVAPSVADS
jgi:hypothetical protein